MLSSIPGPWFVLDCVVFGSDSGFAMLILGKNGFSIATKEQTHLSNRPIRISLMEYVMEWLNFVNCDLDRDLGLVKLSGPIFWADQASDKDFLISCQNSSRASTSTSSELTMIPKPDAQGFGC